MTALNIQNKRGAVPLDKGSHCAALCITVAIWIAAAIIAYIFLDVQRESDIKDEMGGSVEVTQYKTINHSVVILAIGKNTSQYAVYDKLPIKNTCHKVAAAAFDGEDYFVLSNGWHAYVMKVDKNGFSVLNIDRWNGQWIRTIKRICFSILILLLLIVVIRALAARKRELADPQNEKQ